MLFLFRRKTRRQWKLKYTFLHQGQQVHESDRFLSQAEAEERFAAMQHYHAQLQQPITHAQLTGPNGVRRDLLIAKSGRQGKTRQQFELV